MTDPVEPVVAGPGERIAAGGASFVMREWEHGPNDGPRLHVHHGDDEAWHVLEGTLRFRFADGTFEAGPGTTVFAPAGAPHTYGNPGPGNVRYLIVSTQRVFDLIEAVHRPGVDEAELFRTYDSEVLE